MKISQMHLSLSIQYAADAIAQLASIIDSNDRGRPGRLDSVAISAARTSLERSLRSLKDIPMPKKD